MPLRDVAALRIGIVISADGGKGSLIAARGENDGESLLDLSEIVWREDAAIPACAGIELVDEIGPEDVGEAGDQRALGLRRVGVEDDVDGIGV